MAMVAIASSFKSCARLPHGRRDGTGSSSSSGTSSSSSRSSGTTSSTSSSGSSSSTFRLRQDPQVRCRALILCSGMEIQEEGEEKEKPVSSRTISIFWDLDNKPPTTSPFAAAMHLKMAASAFGSVRETLAFANRHAFTYVPEWVRDERRERKILDILEKKGAVKPASPYLCSLCGRKCKTNLDLKKHFKQLHERERQKRINRLGQLKGKRRTKFRDAISAKEERYREASKDVILPKTGYGLAQELRRAGVFVRRVEDKPQAADEALKRRMAVSLSGGSGSVDCVCLVSDDSDFGKMLSDARLRHLRTVVIGNTKALQRYADAWLSWDEVGAGTARRRAVQAAKQWCAQDSLARELLDDREERKAMVEEDLKRLDYRSRLLLASSPSMDLRDEGGGLLLPSAGIRPAARSIIWTSAFSEAEEEEEEEGFFGEEGEAEDSDEDDGFQS